MTESNETEELKAEIHIKTRIDKVVDPESSRYALGCVQATPRSEGEVFLTATNGRSLVVLPAEGHVDQERLIPGEVLPKKKVGRLAHKVRLNGHWLSSDGRYSAEPEGRFPQTQDCFAEREHHEADVNDPAVLWAGHSIQVSLDPKLLLEMAEAMNESDRVLTLFLRANKAGVVEHSINVLGEKGVGVLMPCSTDKRAGARWDAMVKEYKAAKYAIKIGAIEKQQPAKEESQREKEVAQAA